MSLVEKVEYNNYELSSEEIVKDNESYNEYLLKKAKDIPDIWLPEKRRYSSEARNSIYFDKFGIGLKTYVKAFALDLYSFVGNEFITVNDTISSVRIFLNTISKEELLDINSSFQKHYENYLGLLRDRVKNTVKNENSMAVSTARNHAIQTLKFIVFLNAYSKKNTWASSHNITTSLPVKLAKYFNKKELQAFQNELVALQGENKTKSIAWGVMYETMKFIDSQPTSYIKTAIIVMAEAGLRISEVRQLKVDCIEPVSKTEQLAVEKYLKDLDRSAPIELDYSESYWLKYDVVKKKGGDLERGTPILVGKKVKQAIDDLMVLTAEIREEFGSNMLFVNKTSTTEVGVRSYSALLEDRNRLIEKGMPFFKFYQLRATFATILHRLGVPLGMIEKYMNHVESDITAGYINDKRNENMNLFNKILDDNIADIANNKNYNDFHESLLSVVENSEFAGLSHSSQIKMFERLMRRYDVKLNSSEHGTCVLPSKKVCPNGYEGVNPCHTSECNSFKPDKDEESKQFFILSLARAENKETELRKFAEEHGSAEINYESIDRAKRSLISIIQQIGGGYA